MDKQGYWQKIFLKIGVLVGLVVFFFVGMAIHKETVKKRQVQEEIEKLKNESEKISKENSLLREKIKFLASENYLEMEARDKLNLKSPDEKVVIVKQNTIRENFSKDSADAAKIVFEEEKNEVNYKKWWSYFFRY